MPSTRLILIAHAASAATRRAAFASGDETIEAAGLAAASMLCGRFLSASESLASPAKAAGITAEALGLNATTCPALSDIDAGGWTGQSIVDIAPAEVAAWFADPCYVDHGGESLAALVERIAGFLTARLAVRGTTVAVTHAAPIRAALVSALCAPASAFWRIDVPPLAALVLGSDGTRWSLRGLGPLARMIEASRE